MADNASDSIFHSSVAVTAADLAFAILPLIEFSILIHGPYEMFDKR